MVFISLINTLNFDCTKGYLRRVVNLLIDLGVIITMIYGNPNTIQLFVS